MRLFIYFFPIARCLWFRKRFESQFRFSELWSCLLGSECHMVLKIKAKVVISRFKKLKFRRTYFRGQAIFCIFRGKGQKTRIKVPRKFVPAKISSLKVYCRNINHLKSMVRLNLMITSYISYTYTKNYKKTSSLSSASWSLSPSLGM